MRYCLGLFILICCAQLSALESPLIMRGQGDLTGVINPNTGTIQLYRTAGKNLMQTGSYYFLTDLEFLSNVPHPAIDPDEVEMAASWTKLRMGERTEPNILNDIKRQSPNAWKVMMESENEFWTKIPEYEGDVVGAIGRSHFFLCFPKMHALLVYEVKNGKDVGLVAYRNIGPDLMLSGTLNSDPNPAKLLKELPSDVQEAFKERNKAREEAIENGEIVQLKEPKPWIAGLQNEKIVMLEPANQRLLVYEFNGKMLQLKSARNLEIELMVPPGIGVQTRPDPGQQYKNYQKMLTRARKVPYTLDELKALASVAGTHRKQGGEEEIQAFIDENFYLTIDFIKQRKLLLYSPDEGGSGIKMLSVRDYTLENAIALHIDLINRENKAEGLFKQAKSLASKRSRRASAMRYLKLALKYKPSLVEEAEDKLAKHLAEQNGWAEMIKQARADWEKQIQQEEQMKKMLEEQEKNK